MILFQLGNYLNLFFLYCNNVSIVDFWNHEYLAQQVFFVFLSAFAANIWAAFGWTLGQLVGINCPVCWLNWIITSSAVYGALVWFAQQLLFEVYHLNSLFYFIYYCLLHLLAVKLVFIAIFILDGWLYGKQTGSCCLGCSLSWFFAVLVFQDSYVGSIPVGCRISGSYAQQVVSDIAVLRIFGVCCLDCYIQDTYYYAISTWLLTMALSTLIERLGCCCSNWIGWYYGQLLPFVVLLSWLYQISGPEWCNWQCISDCIHLVPFLVGCSPFPVFGYAALDTNKGFNMLPFLLYALSDYAVSDFFGHWWLGCGFSDLWYYALSTGFSIFARSFLIVVPYCLGCGCLGCYCLGCFFVLVICCLVFLDSNVDPNLYPCFDLSSGGFQCCTNYFVVGVVFLIALAVSVWGIVYFLIAVIYITLAVWGSYLGISWNAISMRSLPALALAVLVAAAWAVFRSWLSAVMFFLDSNVDPIWTPSFSHLGSVSFVLLTPWNTISIIKGWYYELLLSFAVLLPSFFVDLNSLVFSPACCHWSCCSDYPYWVFSLVFGFAAFPYNCFLPTIDMDTNKGLVPICIHYTD